MGGIQRVKAKVKDLGKSALYQAWTPKLPAPLELGYIFHTEKIFDDRLFAQLLKFCDDYAQISGVRPICTLMTAKCARIAKAMGALGMTEAEYIRRAHQLAERSTLGYHGHFWHDTNSIDGPETEIRGTHYTAASLRSQFLGDVEWFRESGLDHHGLYSAGWWFMHPDLIELLVQEKFRVDFSFSKSPWFQNPVSESLMRRGRVMAGEPIWLQTSRGKILSVQNFVGCHTTAHPKDFVRNVNRLLEADMPPNLRPRGVTNSHDYDLDPVHTLQCLQWLKENERVRFLGAKDFLEMSPESLRVIVVKPKS